MISTARAPKVFPKNIGAIIISNMRLFFRFGPLRY